MRALITVVNRLRRPARESGPGSAPPKGGLRRLVLPGLTALLLLVAALAWVAYCGNLARQQLAEAKDLLPALRASVLAGSGSSTQQLAGVRERALRADALTHDPVWTALGALPWVGSPLHTTAGLTRAVRELAVSGLPALATAADTAHPAKVMGAGHGVDVAALRAAVPALQRAADVLRTQRDDVAALPASWLGPVAGARTQLLGQLEQLTGVSRDAVGAAKLLPGMLGGERARTYFVGFQNPAEARGTGGLLDAFAIVRADHGTVTVLRTGANTQLPVLKPPVAGLDPAYEARYATVGGTDMWLNANVSPHFPEVAAAWEAMWRNATGETLDGAVALDPSALAAVLAATGPVSAPGVGTVDAAHIEHLVLVDQYLPQRTVATRKSAMLGVGTATIEALMGGRVKAGVLLSKLTAAASAGHVLLHSTDPVEQQALTGGGLAGPVDDGAEPYAKAVLVNASGNKLDTWLTQSLDYRVTRCTAAERMVQVAVTLHNGVPASGLPEYITVRSDQPPVPVPVGQNRSELQVLLTKGARVTAATLDGRVMAMAPPPGELPTATTLGDTQDLLQASQVRGRPTYGLDLEVPVGGTRTMVLTVAEPPSRSGPLLPTQAMVNPVHTSADTATCRLS